MDTVKDRNCKDLIEAEEIKKRWKEYTDLYKKDLNNSDNHSGVISHSEPDILECEVKWTLGQTAANKASGGDGISAELFKILKDDAIKVLHSICQQIWKAQLWPQDLEKSILISILHKGNTKECSNHQTMAFIPHASKLLLLLSHFSCVWLCATGWTAAHQDPLSLGFSRQEYWSGWPFPSPHASKVMLKIHQVRL